MNSACCTLYQTKSRRQRDVIQGLPYSSKKERILGTRLQVTFGTSFDDVATTQILQVVSGSVFNGPVRGEKLQFLKLGKHSMKYGACMRKKLKYDVLKPCQGPQEKLRTKV